MTDDRPLAVQRYLAHLEIAAKQCLGISPRDVLSDAEAHLFQDAENLLRAEPGLDQDALYEHFVTTFGKPDDVAKAYEKGDRIASWIPAAAPGWRIHCPKCGRSAPAAKIGITRIGARSVGKRVLGWCSECRWFRWLSLTRDLDCVSILPTMQDVADEHVADEASKSAQAQQRTARWSRLFGLWLLALIALPLGVQSLVVYAQRADTAGKSGGRKSNVPAFATLPDGWRVVSETQVTGGQLSQFSQRLQIPLASLFNTVLEHDGQQIQINTIATAKLDDAARLKQNLRKSKSNPAWVVQNGTSVFEFVVREPAQARLAVTARYALPIQPTKLTYLVEFKAVPVKSERPTIGPDDRNQMFNLLLQAGGTATPQAIRKLAQQFEFGDTVQLVHNLQQGVVAKWTAEGVRQSSTQPHDELSVLSLQELPKKFDLPMAQLQAEMTIDVKQSRQVDSGTDHSKSLSTTARFPVDAVEVKQLALAIVASSDADAVKVNKLLRWFTLPANMRYDGLTGSRYGTRKILEQRFGRCWDFSDLFVTLARASGVPCRQVYGWLHEREGHVWCDVLIDGRWQMVDPTSGTICGSDYLPFCISDSGEFPLIYASPVCVELR